MTKTGNQKKMTERGKYKEKYEEMKESLADSNLAIRGGKFTKYEQNQQRQFSSNAFAFKSKRTTLTATLLPLLRVTLTLPSTRNDAPFDLFCPFFFINPIELCEARKNFARLKRPRRIRLTESKFPEKKKIQNLKPTAKNPRKKKQVLKRI